MHLLEPSPIRSILKIICKYNLISILNLFEFRLIIFFEIW